MMTRSLADLEAAAQMEVPREIGHAVKAWKGGRASPAMQRIAYEFVVHTLAGIGRLSFALPDEAAVMGWREGRRFVGLQIEEIAERPIADAEPPEPPAKTMVEKAARRTRNSSQSEG